MKIELSLLTSVTLEFPVAVGQRSQSKCIKNMLDTKFAQVKHLEDREYCFVQLKNDLLYLDKTVFIFVLHKTQSLFFFLQENSFINEDY